MQMSEGFAQLVSKLQSDDAAARRDAVERLEPFGKQALAALVQALQDENMGVRDAACHVLSLLASQQAAERLVPLLASDNIAVRNLANELLTGYGAAAFPALADGLQGGDPDVRKFIVDILGAAGLSEAVPLLISLLDDPVKNVAVSAAEALGRLGDARAITPLIAHAGHCEGMLPVVADALGRLPCEQADRFLLSLLPARDLTVSLVALASLSESGRAETARHIYTLLPALPHLLQTEALKTVFAILHRLQDTPDFIDFDSWKPQLIEILHQAETPSVAAICASLPDGFYEENLGSLLPLFCHSDEEVRYLFREKLLRIEPEALLAAARDYPGRLPEEVRLSVATLIAENDLALAFPLLEELVHSPEPNVRIVVAQCLGFDLNAKSEAMLTALTDDLDDAVQESAYAALSGAEAPYLQGLFEKGMQHDQLTIREMCADALARISPDRCAEKLAELLTSDKLDDLFFALALVEKYPGFASFSDVKRLLAAENMEVRARAARALAVFKHGEAFETGTLLLADIEREVRLAAFEALLDINPDQSETPIRTALSDPDIWIQIAGLEAMVHLNRADLIPSIYSLLYSPNRMVQMRAIEALIALKGEYCLPEIRNVLVEMGENAEKLLAPLLSEGDGCF